MKGDFVRVGVETCGVRGAGLVKEKKMDYASACNDKWEDEVECEEAG